MLPDSSTARPNQDLILQWFGDIGLNGLFCDPQNHSALRSNMAEIAAALGPCDLRIANWESPLWGDGTVNTLKSPRVCTTRQAAESILPLGLNVALLASNHAYDSREPGFENTIQFLDDHGVRWLGAGRSPEEAAKPLLLTCRGHRLGLLSYLGHETHPSLPDGAGVFLNMLDPDRMLSEVKSISRDVDITLVALHWGLVEQISYPTIEQRRLARQVIEAGAKIVACHHAHCLQGHEPWRDGHIFYGLGNFLFDACFQGRPGVWPAMCRRVGVATTVVGQSGVHRAGLTFFVQEHLLLKPDGTPSRRRRQERLNRSLRSSDRRLRRLYNRRLFVQRFLLPPVRFVQASGGLLPAFRRLGQRLLLCAQRLWPSR
jgi:hypothetical protein